MILSSKRGDGDMKQHVKKPHPMHPKHRKDCSEIDELFEKCLKKGLIEKTPYGYYIKPEFFETLELYDE